MERPILGKYIIKGKIILETGLKIGGQELGVNIGGIDNPVIRNPLTGEPYIPGSSVKGKMRSLMERLLNLDISGNKVRRHECEERECKVCRVFGSTSKEGNNIPSRLLVRDAFLTEDSKTKLLSMETDLPYTEWKTENALDRVTCKADPRSFERIPAGAEFEFEIIYTAENEKHIKEDLENIATALELLEDDYLGGNGSRGYGKVKFSIEKVIFKSADYYKGEGTPVEKEVKGGVEGFKKAIPEIVKG
ncbi:MAG TPA: type III-A CRISPR-associated RAMP protein Csm3 [Thermotoga sp.]|uniref:type III-A CRISPR-associated RAMP protein Csm3 n=1 Tax=Thermotoga sp. (strain RQ2) TaxID=126740 RepID=UPI0001601736|nr:type III-A CRISPR-associated RAMP protein Csm3 [Thermotoga sp. RQ2]ACB09361.1 CRISPR-associated RAMP protein, Csm3 family [Thermotoga sp. RQ2]HBF69041.1 type III-A CRISPR-associated RAMP protein Csm3 [Thermotoga sp.]